MRWIDILVASFSNLMRRKLRSALTMLGVIIGSTAIIVTISLGYGVEKTQTEAMESNTNLKIINVSPNYGYEEQKDGGHRVTKIDDKVLNQLKRVSHVEAVAPITTIYGGVYFTFKIGKLEAAYVPFVVIDTKAAQKLLEIKEGSFFTSRTDRIEFLLSQQVMMEFYDPKKSDYPEYDYMEIYEKIQNGEDLPVSDSVDWLKDKYTITMKWDDYDDVDPVTYEPKHYEKEYKGTMRGVVKSYPDDPNFWFLDYCAVITTDTYKALMKENKKLFKDYNMPDFTEYSTVLVMADSVDNVEQVVRDLKEIGVIATSTLDTIRQLREQIRLMQVFMGFIGAISMFVAALSIANTMMMSIYERTREIGVMKVLGCKMGNIRMMFLCEAAYIGIIGGGIGIALSHTLSYALNNVPWLQEIVAEFMSSTSSMSSGANTSIIPPELALWTFAFVVAISIISGVYPAQRAMHLSSLAAIRSD